MRLVRVDNGDIVIDLSGKKAGRGAYICRSRGCWETALKGGQIEHSLRITIGQQQKEQLIKAAEGTVLSVEV